MKEDPKKVQGSTETTTTTMTATPGPSRTSYDSIIESTISVIDRSVTIAEESVVVAQRNLKRAQDFLANAQARAEEADRDFRSCNLAASSPSDPHDFAFQPVVTRTISDMDRSVTIAEENVVAAQRDLKRSQDFLANAQVRLEEADRDFRSCNLAASALSGPHDFAFQPVITRTINAMGRLATTAKECVVVAQQDLKRAQDHVACAQAIAEAVRNNADTSGAGQKNTNKEEFN